MRHAPPEQRRSGRGGPSDTSPEALAVLVEGYRRMSPMQRLERALSMTQTLKVLIRARLREEYPDASEEELRMRFGERWLGRDLMKKAYGWDPDAASAD